MGYTLNPIARLGQLQLSHRRSWCCPQGSLLVHKASYGRLYARLDVPVLAKDQLLAQVLLPHWGELAEGVRGTVLSCVEKSWLALMGNADLVAALGDTTFVTTGELLTVFVRALGYTVGVGQGPYCGCAVMSRVGLLAKEPSLSAAF